MPTVYKAFVSSTFEDLKEHRAFVIGALRAAGFSVDPMEDWTADAEEPRRFSVERLEGCDICVLLVALRRGFVPPGAPYDALASDLVRLEVDVIVATTSVAIAAAKQATQRIPIVMCPSFDPVTEGLITSLRRPGGNVTGIAILMEETTGKRLQLLREMVPKAARVAFLWNAPANKQLESADVAARKLGVRLLSFEVNTADALPDAFDAAAKGSADR